MPYNVEVYNKKILSTSSSYETINLTVSSDLLPYATNSVVGVLSAGTNTRINTLSSTLSGLNSLVQSNSANWQTTYSTVSTLSSVWSTFATQATGVSQIVAGANIAISPAGGTGIVTISAAPVVTQILSGAGISLSPTSGTGAVTITSRVNRGTFGPVALNQLRGAIFSNSGYNPLFGSPFLSNSRDNFYQLTPPGNTAMLFRVGTGNGSSSTQWPITINPFRLFGTNTINITMYVRVTDGFGDFVHCQLRRYNVSTGITWIDGTTTADPYGNGPDSGVSQYLTDFGGGSNSGVGPDGNRIMFATAVNIPAPDAEFLYIPYFSAYNSGNGATIQDVELIFSTPN